AGHVLGLDGVALVDGRGGLGARLVLELGEGHREHGDGAQDEDEGDAAALAAAVAGEALAEEDEARGGGRGRDESGHHRTAKLGGEGIATGILVTKGMVLPPGPPLSTSVTFTWRGKRFGWPVRAWVVSQVSTQRPVIGSRKRRSKRSMSSARTFTRPPRSGSKSMMGASRRARSTLPGTSGSGEPKYEISAWSLSCASFWTRRW